MKRKILRIKPIARKKNHGIHWQENWNWYLVALSRVFISLVIWEKGENV